VIYPDRAGESAGVFTADRALRCQNWLRLFAFRGGITIAICHFGISLRSGNCTTLPLHGMTAKIGFVWSVISKPPGRLRCHHGGWVRLRDFHSMEMYPKPSDRAKIIYARNDIATHAISFGIWPNMA
jgi:hypothetical protein